MRWKKEKIKQLKHYKANVCLKPTRYWSLLEYRNREGTVGVRMDKGEGKVVWSSILACCCLLAQNGMKINSEFCFQ